MIHASDPSPDVLVDGYVAVLRLSILIRRIIVAPWLRQRGATPRQVRLRWAVTRQVSLAG
jgi:hypothetical protein